MTPPLQPSSSSSSSSSSEKVVDENQLTMEQILEQQASLESEAAEVLPFDISRCTRSLGPIRQSVYSCLTCNPTNKKTQQVNNDDKSNEEDQTRVRAGICSSCSVSCHSDHELVELFIRRRFTCECGTMKCNPGRCNLSPEDPETQSNQVIETNRYDHNFDGSFCICERGKNYDPETETEDMFQCLACEDWRHSSCLGPHPDSEEWDDLICSECVNSDSDLREILMRHAGKREDGMIVSIDSEHRSESSIINPDRADHGVNEKGKGLSSSKEDDRGDGEERANESDLRSKSTEETLNDNGTATSKVDRSPPLKRSISETTDPAENSDAKRQRETHNNNNNNSSSSSTLGDECKAPYRDGSGPLSKPNQKSSNVYLLSGWRERWCRCKRCFEKLSKKDWLISEEEVWEPEKDQDSMKSLHELGIEAFKNLPHDQKLEGLYAYKRLSDEILKFLRPFAERKVLVKEDDIKDFFENVKNEVLDRS